MSDIISAIRDDINEYVELCEKYNVEPKTSRDNWGNMLIDCYGKHATKLKERARLEYEQKRKA